MTGEQLKKLRKRHDVKQDELAQWLGYSSSSIISQWENDHQKINTRAERAIQLFFRMGDITSRLGK